MQLFRLYFPTSGRGKQKKYDPERGIVFLHTPKTSGSALTRGLIAAIGPRSFVPAFDRAVYGSFDGFDTMAPETKGNLYLDVRDLPAGADFIAGHCAFSTFWSKYQDAQFVSFLREPVSRLLSFWLFWRAYTDDDLLPWGLWGDRVRLARKPLQDFLSSPEIACHTDNLVTRLLLWPDPLIPDGDFIDPRNDKALIRKAAARLKRFAYVDVIENPSFLQSLEAWLGRPLTYPVVNQTKVTPPLLTTPLYQALSPNALTLLDERSRLDLSLWATITEQRVTSLASAKLRERTLMRNIARHSDLLTHASRTNP